MDPSTIAQLKQGACENPQEAFFLAQVQDRSESTTKTGSPYLELTLTDPEEQNDWTLLATVDCKASDTTNQVVLHFQQLRSLI